VDEWECRWRIFVSSKWLLLTRPRLAAFERPLTQVNLNEATKRADCAEVRIEEIAADKGYHAAKTLELCDALGRRTYIPEPKRPHKARWTNKPMEYHTAVVNNRRRVRREKSRKLQRLRSERVERSFAHVCDSGGARRSWLRGLSDVTKRYLIVAAAHNLGRVLWSLVGVGKPRSLQGSSGLATLVQSAIKAVLDPLRRARQLCGNPWQLRPNAA
jgi:hypothetical protein